MGRKRPSLLCDALLCNGEARDETLSRNDLHVRMVLSRLGSDSLLFISTLVLNNRYRILTKSLPGFAFTPV